VALMGASFIMAWSIDPSRVASVWGTDLLGVAEMGCALLRVRAQ
jgi:hypothetical protein